MEIWSKCDICGRDIPVGELCYGLKNGNCICKDCCTGFENCTFTIAPAPTLTPPNEWVSVEERLPPLRKNVLACAYWHEHWGVYMGWNSGHGWMVSCGIGQRSDVQVSHWMPLPAPPDRRPPEGGDGPASE